MPPVMMTKVWPRAMISRIAMLAPMPWKLNRSKKPCPVIEKNTTRPSRKSHAQNRLRVRSARRGTISRPETASVALLTIPSPSPRPGYELL